jgi:uncharacterized protein (DUF2384 family)
MTSVGQSTQGPVASGHAGAKIPADLGHSKVADLGSNPIRYDPNLGLTAYIEQVQHALPLQLVALEREGVDSAFIADLAPRIGMTASAIYDLIKIPRSTARRKLNQGKPVDGCPGYAALGLIKLLALAQDICEDSTHAEAQNFDTAKWLGTWIRCPLPALGGQKPADLLDTPSGTAIVTKLLGAIRSGAYL